MRYELRMSGVGGQGIITLGYVFGRAAALHDKKQVIMTEFYGPEVTGGFARADVVVDDEMIDYPMVVSPEFMVLMDNEGRDRDAHLIAKNGKILYDSDLVTMSDQPNCNLYPIPAFATADQLGKKVVANVVMMGALQVLTKAVTKEALEKALLERVPKGTEELNLSALKAGYKLGEQALGGNGK